MILRIGRKYRYKNWSVGTYYRIDNIIGDRVLVTYRSLEDNLIKEEFRLEQFGEPKAWILVIDREDELNAL